MDATAKIINALVVLNLLWLMYFIDEFALVILFVAQLMCFPLTFALVCWILSILIHFGVRNELVDVFHPWQMYECEQDSLQNDKPAHGMSKIAPERWTLHEKRWKTCKVPPKISILHISRREMCKVLQKLWTLHEKWGKMSKMSSNFPFLHINRRKTCKVP